MPFLAEITRWLAGGAAILFEEFGLATAPPRATEQPLLVSEAAAAGYTGRALDGLRARGLHRAPCFGASATTRRRSHAVPPFDLAAHERSFGLWRADGSPSPPWQR